MLLSLSIALSFASQAFAHGGVIGYTLGSQYYNGFVAYNTPVGQSTIQREWDTYDPITDPTSTYLSCNTNGANLGTGQKTATVAAGSEVTAYWGNWGHTIGPVMVYMAACGGDCTSATTSSLSWFKIDEAGLINGTIGYGTWGMGELAAGNSSWTSTIPSKLAPGNYMLRHELLAIHIAGQPQFYPECAQLTVTGSGTSTPSGSYLVKLPGAYSMSDPGVGIDIYNDLDGTNYTIPGPAVWS